MGPVSICLEINIEAWQVLPHTRAFRAHGKMCAIFLHSSHFSANGSNNPDASTQ
jgi:hypothetical protein